MCQQHLKSLWDNFKRNNIPIKGVPKEEREQEIENLFEKMTENFSNLVKENRHISSGSTESPKQNELKVAHTKTLHN